MNYLNKLRSAQKFYTAFFFAFSLLSTIFNGSTRVNNIFHLSAILFIISLFQNKELRSSLTNEPNPKRILIITFTFLIYYSISNLWTAEPFNIRSTLTHSVYIILYLGMLITTLNSQRRNQLFTIITFGLVFICLYTLVFDYHNVLIDRGVSANNPGPENVIDLSGYASIGIILALIIFRDTRKNIVLIAIPIFISILLLTQSRGPFIALLASLIFTTHYRFFNKKNVLYLCIILMILSTAILISNMGEMLLSRFGTLYEQSFLRLSIWRHTLELWTQAPIFGYGFDKQLQFTNYSGEFITTTHSLYLGALLKGGIVGFILFISLIIYGLKIALQSMKQGMRLEAALYIYMLIFYISQGIFVIGNPGVSWYLFWFPLGVIMSRKKQS